MFTMIDLSQFIIYKLTCMWGG